jgi:2,3-bisphosphoglycerate-independent phosphoglycerate mutase
VWDATIAALGVIDAELERVVEAIDRAEAADPDGPGAVLAITADHGNADDLRDDTGRPVTAHSLNPVPFLLLGRSVAGRRLTDGVLADVAPTLLELADLPTWPAISGHSLLAPATAPAAAPAGAPDRA